MQAGGIDGDLRAGTVVAVVGDEKGQEDEYREAESEQGFAELHTMAIAQEAGTEDAEHQQEQQEVDAGQEVGVLRLVPGVIEAGGWGRWQGWCFAVQVIAGDGDDVAIVRVADVVWAVFHRTAAPQGDEEEVAVVENAVEFAPALLESDTAVIVDGQPLRVADDGGRARVVVFRGVIITFLAG